MHSLVYGSSKVLLTALIIVVVSEIAKVNTVLGAIIKSLPLISLLAMIWLYVETRDVMRIASFSTSTFCFVLPTFHIFPALLRYGLTFFFIRYCNKQGSFVELTGLTKG